MKLPLIYSTRYPTHIIQVVKRKRGWQTRLIAINTNVVYSSPPTYNTRRMALRNLATVTGIGFRQASIPHLGGFQARIRLVGAKLLRAVI